MRSRRLPSTLRARTACAAALCAGCTAIAPAALPPGTPIEQARGVLGGPTGEYPLAEGGTRLEFARGSWGRQTWMLDFDASGRLVRTEQVLDEAHFATVTPGLPAEEVLRRIGRPAEIFPVGWQRLVVWNYRWWQGDCVWYQVSISRDTDRVTEAGYGTDPACDRGGDRRRR
jgi:hypothetical protein